MANVASIRRWIYGVSALLSLIAIPAWLIWIAPCFKKIPNNFTYSADILSLDNFYDENLKKFEGEQISKTIFRYKVISSNAKWLTIQNIFDVSKLSKIPIFYASRMYYIDPFEGSHVDLPGVKKSRQGYLFAPRYANQKDFVYWHVNYDAPALMKFVDKEKIDGLMLYHYAARYQADQTINLTYLPGVPEKRGVKTKIYLQLWIEPISGWLVKYEDNTLAYFYDIKTGKELYPWNKFSNRYTEASIHEQVNHARKLKQTILYVDFVVPIGFILIAVICILAIQPKMSAPEQVSWLQQLSKKIKNNALTIILGIFFITLLISLYLIFWYKRAPAVFSIGIAQWNNSQDYNDIVKGFKDGLKEEGFIQNENIFFIIKNSNTNVEKQITNIQYFLNNNVDLIFTLSTPGTLIAKGITNVTPILFSGVSYPEETGIVDTLESSKNNLVGIRNYVSPAQQFFMFEKLYPETKTLGFVYRKGSVDSEIQLQEFEEILAKRGITIIPIAGIDKEDLMQQLENKKSSFNVLYFACDTLVRQLNEKNIKEFILHNKVPSFSCNKENVINGALLSYVGNYYLLGKLSGKKAAFILRGAEPHWLHSETLYKGFLMLNLPIARTIGITVSDELIEKTDYVVNK